MHTYKAFRRRSYSTLTPLSTRTFFLCLGFTSHMMSTNSPSFFNRINLSSGVSVLSYATGTSKMDTTLTLCVLMTSLVNKASREMFDEDESSLVIYHIRGFPFVHALPFIFHSALFYLFYVSQFYFLL